MTILSTMNMAQQALAVNQASLNVVSNNISNMNTESYSRQRVELAPAINYVPIGDNIYSQINSAAGVELDAVTRYSDQYLSNYYRENNATLAYYEKYQETATNLENIMNELNGTGLESALTSFYEAAREVNNNPKDSVARLDFLQKAEIVANLFNSKAEDLSELRTSLVGDVNVPYSLDGSAISLAVNDVNSILSQIAGINGDILKISAGDLAPNNLLDRRDALLNDLSALMPIEVTDNVNGTNTIKINGVEVIVGNKLKGELTVREGTDDTPAILDLKNENGLVVAENINRFITDGKIGAILDAGSSNEELLTPKTILKDLDNLAQQIARTFNEIQSGTGSDGLTAMAINSSTMQLMKSEELFFELPASNDINDVTASNLTINSKLLDDPMLLAAARVDIGDYDPNAIGNDLGILAMLETRGNTYMNLTNTTFEGFISKMTGEVGLKTENITNSLENQSLVVEQISTSLNSTIGVNLDEELVDLIKYQRAYEASARVFNTCNEILDVLVTLGE